jgi:hypothetical protein
MNEEVRDDGVAAGDRYVAPAPGPDLRQQPRRQEPLLAAEQGIRRGDADRRREYTFVRQIPYFF